MYSNINRYCIKSHTKPYFLIPGFIFRVTCSRPPNRAVMDRNHITIGTSLQLENQDRQYWAKASPSEKFETITYLRECFYGEEATTGRLPRVYRVLKR